MRAFEMDKKTTNWPNTLLVSESSSQFPQKRVRFVKNQRPRETSHSWQVFKCIYLHDVCVWYRDVLIQQLSFVESRKQFLMNKDNSGGVLEILYDLSLQPWEAHAISICSGVQFVWGLFLCTLCDCQPFPFQRWCAICLAILVQSFSPTSLLISLAVFPGNLCCVD